MQARQGAAINKMTARRNVGGIFWGITLIVIGGLILARNFGYSIPIWGYVARYWPALLIVWGLLKFVDYYRFRNTGDRRPLFSAGEVALLVFVILAGAAVTTAANISSDVGRVFDIDGVDLWDITGNNFTFDEHEEAMVPDGSSIDIDNMFGDVDVRPSEGDRVLLDVKKTIRAANKDEAERLSKDFTFSISTGGDRYRIASSRDGIRLSRQRYKSSLTLQVPKSSKLRINNRAGKVEVADLEGDQDISNRFGNVDIRNITGDLKVKNEFGQASVENLKGGAVISEGMGNLSVSFEKLVQKPIEVSSRFGNVTIKLPADSSFSVDANTQFGRIDSDFEGLRKSKPDFTKDSIVGQIGQGGPPITVTTFNGNIRLVRRS